jgi:RNA polymerase sigma factor (sigma-70 family)
MTRRMTRFKVDPLEGKDPRESIEDAWACVLQWDAYLKLQVNTRCRYAPPGLEPYDVESLARELTIRQLQRWDPERLTLSAWTRQAMWYSVGLAICRIRPTGVRRASLIAHACSEAWAMLSEKLGRGPTYEEVSELASQLGRSFTDRISPNLVHRWAAGCNPDDNVRFHHASNGDEGRTWEELVPDEPEEGSSEEYLLDALRRKRVREAITHLPERLRTVIDMHYFQELTLIEIAEHLNISRRRVQQLDQRAKGILMDLFDSGALIDPESWFDWGDETEPRSARPPKQLPILVLHSSHEIAMLTVAQQRSPVEPDPEVAPSPPTPAAHPQNDEQLLYAEM